MEESDIDFFSECQARQATALESIANSLRILTELAVREYEEIEPEEFERED